MKDPTQMTKTVLKGLGIKRTSRGYYSILLAMELLGENESRLTSVTKEIYMEVGRRLGQDWRAVERNMRTVIRKAWRCRLPALMELTDCTEREPPSNSSFLSDLFDHIWEQDG